MDVRNLLVCSQLKPCTGRTCACVQVYCVHTEPNYSLPWQRKRQYSSSSSGFIIAGK